MAIRNDILKAFDEITSKIKYNDPRTESQIVIVRRALKEYQRELNARIRIERKAPKWP